MEHLLIQRSADTAVERRLFVLRLMRSLAVPEADVEDMAHQSLLKFLVGGYADRGLAVEVERALLARIAYNAWVDEIRRRRAVLVGDALELEIDPAPIEETHDRIRRVRELVAIAGLMDDDIELLNDRFARGLTTVSIAERDGIHVNTVRRRLAGVIERLRRAAAREAGEIECTRSPRA